MSLENHSAYRLIISGQSAGQFGYRCSCGCDFADSCALLVKYPAEVVLSQLVYVSHPELVIDPTVPVPRWHLSENGIRRMRLFAGDPAVAGVTSIWASTEAKAIEAAGILGWPA